jgi:hypothetical protein
MTQIPAESNVWRRVEDVEHLGDRGDFPTPREPHVTRYGFEPGHGPARAAEDDLLPPFPEAHRGEWLDDPHYMQLRREHECRLDEDYAAWRRERFGREFEAWRNARPRLEPFVSPAGDERAAYGDRRDVENFFERS